MSTRRLLIAVCILVASMVIGGMALAQEPVVLRMVVGANAEEFETRKRAIEEFERLNPDIKVELELLLGGTAERLTNLAAGTSPDVGMEWELDFAQFAAKDAYLDLNQFIERDPDFAEYLSQQVLTPLVKTFEWDGKQYVLPEQNAAVVMFYNKDLVAEAGLSEPPDDWSDTSWNWSTFLDYAQKMTRTSGADQNVTHYGYGDMWWTQLSMMLWGWSNGGQWFDNQLNPTRSTMNNPNMVEAIQFYADLWLEYRVAPTWPERVQFDTPARFAEGQLGMGIGGHWFVPWFTSTSVDFDVAPLPVGPNGKTGMSDLGTTGLGIFRTTRHPEEAWRLVKFLTGHEGQTVYAESGLFVPVTRSAVEAFVDSEPHTERAWLFFSASEYANNLPVLVDWGSYVANAFNPMIHDVMEGRQPAVNAAMRVDEWTNAAIFQID